MIRLATCDDIPAIVEMGRKFVDKAWSERGIAACDVSMAQTCWNLINGDDGVVFVAEQDGALFASCGAVIYPWHFNRSVFAGQELWWWSEGAKAKDMIRHMEEWAASKGATSFVMGRIDGMRDGALHRVFCHAGYDPSEHMYMRSLGNGNCNGDSDIGCGGAVCRREHVGRVESFEGGKERG